MQRQSEEPTGFILSETRDAFSPYKKPKRLNFLKYPLLKNGKKKSGACNEMYLRTFGLSKILIQEET